MNNSSSKYERVKIKIFIYAYIYFYIYVCNNTLTEVLIHYNGKEKNLSMQESVNVIGLVSVIVDKKSSNIADERLVNIVSNPVTLNVKKQQ